jgi:RNA polymerase sigma-70 factor (ECF subfamily)
MRFRGWIVRVTWRLAIDRWRSDRRRIAREERSDPPPHVATAEELAHASQRAARLWEALDALPEKLRIVTVLAAIEGHDVKEIGELLGIPAGTVKSRMFLARQALAEKLKWLANNSTSR